MDDFTSREISRPSLDAALDYLDEIGFDILIVYTIDRLARDSYIRQTLERELDKLGASVEYVLGNYEETPEGEIRKDLDATFAKWENATRVERCNRGKIRKAQNGKFVTGRTPYGYVMDPDALGGLAIDTKQARAAQRIFNMFIVEHYSMREIARALTKEGIPTKQGKAWSSSAISMVLGNTAYIGYVFYNKRKRVGRKYIPRPR